MMFSKLTAYTLLTVAYVKAQTLYLAGDSTMAADDGNAAIIGWGTAVGKYINVPVVNKAIAGTSSRTFTTEGRCMYFFESLDLSGILINPLFDDCRG